MTGELVDDRGRAMYRIDGVETMEPFLTTVVSDVDLWMFVSSTGALTAGRRDADHALFPYLTDDRIHRSAGIAGPVTIVRRLGVPDLAPWQPFDATCPAWCTRSLSKSTIGDLLVFEERNDEWGLSYRAVWSPSPTYGWVREVELANLDGDPIRVEVIDGLLDVMPAGIDAFTEQVRSNLADAYKRSEAGPWGTTALYTLESLVTDRAEPAEALAATAVWSTGFPGGIPTLDERAVGDVRAGRPPRSAHLVTGRPGAYLLHGEIDVPPGSATSWTIVADTALDHGRVAALGDDVQETGIAARVGADIAAGHARLTALLGGADAFQRSADPIADAHHTSNVLFNSMRGGVFPYGDEVPIDDLLAFLHVRNQPCHDRHEPILRALGARVRVRRLHEIADDSADPDLVRLVLEYLPLTFARRHGDPSRPWNSFAIEIHDEQGNELLTYEGNWRDIFQNWEALLRSFPAFFPHVVAKFVDASTADGHNPYRLTRDAIDWEVPDPDDPWSNIGYWGDHQIVYLLRLLEGWDRFDPGELDRWLDRPIFTYADVPYTIAEHDAMVREPHDTITYDLGRAREIEVREARWGTDGRLAVDRAGDLVRVGLLEKLIVPALAKLSAFVPGGGIWMNTQRPEWNDANNALAGTGLSVVTLAHLVRYLRYLRSVVARSGLDTVAVTPFVAQWLSEITEALSDHDVAAATDGRRRRELVDALGAIGTANRRRIAEGVEAARIDLSTAAVERWCTIALAHLEPSLERSRRADGLFHSYNRVSFVGDDLAEILHLGPMLEGQVAALTTGALSGAEALDLVEALYASDLYRPDQDSFMLYPATPRSGFLDRNTLTDDQLARVGFVGEPLADRWRRVFTDGPDGRRHFVPAIVNAATLRDVLDDVDATAEQRGMVEAIHEEVFDHASFTGRSGAMYGYEGLGSVYWHMVAKLLLAVQEQHRASIDDDEPGHVIAALAAAYRRIRDGLGFRRTPAEFGAFPTDCYSHTPAGGGAKQPGMTGQVKEEILTRLGEIGLDVDGGTVRLVPSVLEPTELFGSDLTGVVALTVCETPVTVRIGDAPSFATVWSDGRTEHTPGPLLPHAVADEIFRRTGSVAEIDATTVLDATAD